MNGIKILFGSVVIKLANLVVEKKFDKQYVIYRIPNTFTQNSSFIGSGNFFFVKIGSGMLHFF